MEQKILVVVSILSARNFPRRPGCSILIEAHLNGEVLTSDPVAHSSGLVVINTELAWEMSRKAFQQHKLHRTPIKLLVYAVDGNTSARLKVGYIMLDLRSARTTTQPDPSWYGVLNSSYSRLKPQLQLAVSLEEDTNHPPVEQSNETEEASPSSIPVSLTLDPSGDFYTLGTPSHDHTMHTLSFTLHTAHKLPELLSNQLYFYYNLLGNDITSELFIPPVFSPECASIRIKSSRELLALLFAAQKDIEVHLCSGTESVGKGTLSLGGLASSDQINVTIPLRKDGCTVDVTVKLEQSSVPPLTPSSQTSPPPQQHSHAPPPSQEARLPSPTTYTHTPTPLPSAKRNLTQSFEEASLPTPTHSASPVLHTPIHETPPTTSVAPPTSETANTKPNAPNAITSTATSVVHVPNTAELSQDCSKLQSDKPDSSAHRIKFSVDLRSVHNLKMDPLRKCYLRYSYPFFGSPYPVLIQPPILPVAGTDQSFSHSFCSFDFATQIVRLRDHLSHQPLSVEVWQSCDQSPDQIAGLAQIPLGSVLSHDPSLLEGGATRRVCSLRVPITPSPPSQPHTLTLGYLNVVLVFEDFGIMSVDHDTNRPSVPTGGGTSMSSGPGVPGGGSGPNGPGGGVFSGAGVSSGMAVPGMTNVPHGGITNAVPGGVGGPTVTSVPGGLSGPGGAGVLSGPGEGVQSLVGPLEYNTAVELELWKLSQQEAFEEQQKTRETTHMTKLGEELQRREAQRQAMLKQKLEHYSSLERQLQDGLQQLASQQRALVDRESKVKQEGERLARERQLLQDEVQRSQTQFRSQCEQQIEIERMKSAELQSVVNSLKKQVRELEGKVQSREAEFESYRQQIVTRPESKLHAELSILQLEKVELERKLTVLAKSKQHYKEQWTRSLSELASCRQREQAAARERLLTQQRELEAMRMQYIENEHQNSLRQQLNQVKNEVEKLQEHTLSKTQPPPPSPPHTSPPPTQSHPPPLTSQDSTDERSTDPNVARWIEERDILLQTGVYSSTDITIQKLDAKIRAALQHKTTVQ